MLFEFEKKQKLLLQLLVITSMDSVSLLYKIPLFTEQEILLLRSSSLHSNRCNLEMTTPLHKTDLKQGNNRLRPSLQLQYSNLERLLNTNLNFNQLFSSRKDISLNYTFLLIITHFLSKDFQLEESLFAERCC